MEPPRRPLAAGVAVGRGELAAQLRDRVGVHGGETWIVHASMRSLGYVIGGAAAVVGALRDAVGETGTLLMPAFSDPSPDGRFNLLRTPSRTGLLSETFRVTPGVVRSRHPTHSVAGWGAGREALLAGHERSAPLGVGSPLHRAAGAGAQVLTIGCGLTAASVLHVAESVARVPHLGRAWYPGYDRPVDCDDGAGGAWTYRPRDVPGDSSRFGELEPALRERGLLRSVMLGGAACLRFDAAGAVAYAVEVLTRDPLAFLCDQPSCGYCGMARRVALPLAV